MEMTGIELIEEERIRQIDRLQRVEKGKEKHEQT